MPHVEQQCYGCTTFASKHANHLTTSKVRAPLLRVHTTLHDARTNDRETQCNRKRRTRSPLNFKHVQKSDATAGEWKIACNGSDSSCDVGKPSCEYQKAGSQSVLKWSCANCERGFIESHLLWEEFRSCTLCCSYSQSLQFNFIIPPGTHHCCMDRDGIMRCLPKTSTHGWQRATATHPSTNRSRRCLTSVIWRERVITWPCATMWHVNYWKLWIPL